MKNRCFVKSVAQVSCQKPLSEDWFETPETLRDNYVRSQEPDIKGLLSPIEARRTGRILKRALATSLDALRKAHVEMPDAIITGTGKGCIDNSEQFLTDLCEYGETGLKPSLFMQSTHNTISSLVAIHLKCHGYNNTYSHLGISFESSLLDAWLQIISGIASNVLVGCHDEVPPLMSKIVRKNNPEYDVITETSFSTVISSDKENGLCEITDVEILHNPDKEELKALADDEILLLGVNGNRKNDKPYEDLFESLSSSQTVLQYKNIFGDNYSSSAMAFYVAVTVLKEQKIPDFLLLRGNPISEKEIKSITVLNQTEGADWGCIKLSKI